MQLETTLWSQTRPPTTTTRYNNNQNKQHAHQHNKNNTTQHNRKTTQPNTMKQRNTQETMQYVVFLSGLDEYLWLFSVLCVVAIVLCCAVLCCATVLCCVVLWCVVVWCVVLLLCSSHLFQFEFKSESWRPPNSDD